ncbi:related to Epsin-1 [Hanseniaspora guilliermondii]|uniref:Related to Epsin-1 n=1 Tax=Hanseniaspora guilliermondii TaxID=56406 RepID=A0A1L0CPY0_9ASCO|nr:related to Epsin-1 [Hanseniaspora guilliermondii]
MLRAAKNKVNGYTQAQILVRDCTRNSDTEDVPIMELRQLVEYSYNHLEIVPMFEMLDKRLNDKGKYWKHILKALIVLEFLVINGSEMCVTWCKENIYLIKTLREFMWRNPVTDFDHGSKIRLKAKELTSLLLDDARLKRERDMAAGNNSRNRNKPSKSNYDDDLQKALDESMRTAREEEERRRNMQQDQEDLDVALQLSKEEEELKRLQELQRLRQLQLQQQQLQQQNMMYDINGNPISPEEYQQFLQQQQQQQQMQYQQYLQQLQQQQQMLLQQQQYEMYQQQLREQEEANKQNILQQYATSSNPFKKEPEVSKPEPDVPQQTMPQTEPEQSMKRTRTGDAAISSKYSELNNLLMTGPGIDTFGNTGAARIPAHHTKTGTFINSQGTGYYQQQSVASKNPSTGNSSTANPFLKDQYTGLFSTIKEQKTGFGFGNAPSMNTSQGNNEQSLIDL